jgi:hypothetical protein
MNKLRLNTIYITYQGEVNHFGIGTPVIFYVYKDVLFVATKILWVFFVTSEAFRKGTSNSLEVTAEIVNRLKTLRSTQE